MYVSRCRGRMFILYLKKCRFFFSTTHHCTTAVRNDFALRWDSITILFPFTSLNSKPKLSFLQYKERAPIIFSTILASETLCQWYHRFCWRDPLYLDCYQGINSYSELFIQQIKVYCVSHPIFVVDRDPVLTVIGERTVYYEYFLWSSILRCHNL